MSGFELYIIRVGRSHRGYAGIPYNTLRSTMKYKAKRGAKILQEPVVEPVVEPVPEVALSHKYKKCSKKRKKR